MLLVLPFRADRASNDDGSPQIVGLEPIALTRGESDTPDGTDFSVELRGFQDFTLLIAKRDPGQGLVWLAAGCLVVGLLITFWMPRRRVWAKLGDGRARRADGPRGPLRGRDARVRRGARRPGQGAAVRSSGSASPPAPPPPRPRPPPARSRRAPRIAERSNRRAQEPAGTLGDPSIDDR